MAGPAILKIDIVADASKATAQLGRVGQQAESTGSRLKSKFKDFAKVGLAIGGTFAAAKVADFAKDSISAASDLNETVSKTGQIFGDSSKAITDWSKNSSNAFGLSQKDALDAAGTFAIFGKAAGLQGTPLAAFSKSLVSTAADFASFGNTTPQEAIDAIGAALRGETEPIRKYGLMLNDAAIKNQALRMGLIKTTKVPIDPSKRALAVKALIDQFAKGNHITGDFARTSGGLANQQRIMAAKMENLKATIGTQLLPIMLKLLTAFQQIASWASANSDWLVPLAAGITVVVVAIKAWTLANRLLGTSLSLSNPIFLVVTAIVAIGVALFAAYKKSETFRNIVNGAFAAVVNAGKALGRFFTQTLPKAFTATLAFVRKWGPLVLAALVPFIGIPLLIWQHWSQVKGFLARALSGVASTIAAPFESAWNWIKIHVAAPIRNMFNGIAGAISHAMSGVFNAIIGPFESAWNWIQDHVLGPIKSAWNGIAGAINSIHFSVKVPSFIPGIGGKGFTFDPPNVPELATGGVFSRATLAVVGEGSGREVVSPEAMIRRIVREEGGGLTINVTGALDPDAVARQIDSILTRRARRVGGVQRRGAQPVTA